MSHSRLLQVLSNAEQFRESFQRAAAIAANGLSREAREAEMKIGAQRTEAWHNLRDNRLTASAFGNALGCALVDSLDLQLSLQNQQIAHPFSLDVADIDETSMTLLGIDGAVLGHKVILDIKYNYIILLTFIKIHMIMAFCFTITNTFAKTVVLC